MLNNKGVPMAKLFLGAASALIVMSTGLAFAAGYGPQHGHQYNQGYIPGPYVPQAMQNKAPRYAPVPQRRQIAPTVALNANDPAVKVSSQLANLRTFLTKSQDGGVDSAMALNYIQSQIAPDIDFQTMTRMSLGRLANRMTPAQRTAAENTLRNNFTAKLVETMGDIRSTRFSVGKTRRGTSRGELVVPVRLDRWRGQPLTINFRFYRAQGDWKVFDAEANGQSAVLFYRGYFARQWRGG